jgi:transcriptional regulator PpsR
LLKKFRTPKKTLGTLDAEAAGALITAAADVALIIDRKGIVRDVAFGSDDLAADVKGDWLGKPWSDTVTVESRPKIATLLEEASATGEQRFRQVNYPAARGGPDVPILHSTVAVGDEGRVVALGRDLRAIETLQQRLMDVEQSMEREYSRVRHAETRYRLLFQIASEAVLIVDSANHRVIEANPAASQLLGSSSRRLAGRPFPEGFDADGTRAIEKLLAGVQATGRAEDVRATLKDPEREFQISASIFRQDNSAHYLVRLKPASETKSVNGHSRLNSKLLEVLEGSPDGLVVTTPEGQILTANRAFLELAQLATAEQAKGQSLDRWLGRPGVDMRVLINNLRQHGSVRIFATALRGEYGLNTDVEVSGVSALEGDQPCLGFTVRNVGKRAASDAKKPRELPRSVEELTELIGRMPLKDLVRETTDVIERMCIEAALELTGDNRATAAEMLGLSRQSLYAKLRRYGLGDLDPSED